MNTVVTSYLLEPVSDLQTKQQILREKFTALNIKGTLILAEEGLNFTIAAQNDVIPAACSFLDELFQTKMTFQYTKCEFIPFRRLKVKIKPELIAFRDHEERICQAEAFLSAQKRGSHLSPDQWDKLISAPNTYIVDTRNHYEYTVGHFENAVNPKTENFSQLTQWLKDALKDKDETTEIAMYCTGGIRCEKSTAFVKQLGFKNVYHLQGGIINYMKSKISQPSKWQGNLFVFDDRVALNANLDSVRNHVPPQQ